MKFPFNNAYFNRKMSDVSAMLAHPPQGKLLKADILAKFSGGYGTVYICRRDSSLVAIKSIPLPSSDAVNRVMEEAKIMSHLNGHGALCTIGVHHSHFEYPNAVLIEMPYCAGGSLRDYFQSGQMEADDKIFHLFGVSLVVRFLHDQGVIHLDLKPDNVLFGNNAYSSAEREHKPPGNIELLVSDFGISRAFRSVADSPVDAGTIRYMAPEALQGSLPHTSMDVWSFGVMGLELLVGLKFLDQALYSVTSNSIDGLVDAFISAQAERNPIYEKDFATLSSCASWVLPLIASCLQTEPEQRPDFKYITSVLSDQMKIYPKDQERRSGSTIEVKPEDEPWDWSFVDLPTAVRLQSFGLKAADEEDGNKYISLRLPRGLVANQSINRFKNSGGTASVLKEIVSICESILLEDVDGVPFFRRREMMSDSPALNFGAAGDSRSDEDHRISWFEAKLLVLHYLDSLTKLVQDNPQNEDLSKISMVLEVISDWSVDWETNELATLTVAAFLVGRFDEAEAMGELIIAGEPNSYAYSVLSEMFAAQENWVKSYVYAISAVKYELGKEATPHYENIMLGLLKAAFASLSLGEIQIMLDLVNKASNLLGANQVLSSITIMTRFAEVKTAPKWKMAAVIFGLSRELEMFAGSMSASDMLLAAECYLMAGDRNSCIAWCVRALDHKSMRIPGRVYVKRRIEALMEAANKR